LRDDKDFFDVTLACDEDQIQAHKVILSACSPFFRNILRRNPHPNPLLYLKGVKFTDLQYVLNFIYHGEVSVGQEELNTFLAVAEELRIKGLTQNSQHESVKTKKESSTSGYTTSSAKQPDHDSVFKQTQHIPINQQATKKHIHEDEIQEVIPIKSEPKEHCSATATQPRVVSNATVDQEFFTSQAMANNDDSFVYDDTYEDYGEYTTDQYAASGNVEFDKGQTFQDPSELLQFVRRDPLDQKFHCTLCEKFSHKVKPLARNHVESQHFPNTFSYPCDQCEESFDAKSKFNLHRQRKHKQVKNMQSYNSGI